MIVTQSDFHSNPFSGFRQTPSRKSPLLRVILLCPELRPFIIIILMSHQFVMHLIILIFNTSMIPYISLDKYLNRNLYTIPICKICVSFALLLLYCFMYLLLCVGVLCWSLFWYALLYSFLVLQLSRRVIWLLFFYCLLDFLSL